MNKIKDIRPALFAVMIFIFCIYYKTLAAQVIYISHMYDMQYLNQTNAAVDYAEYETPLKMHIEPLCASAVLPPVLYYSFVEFVAYDALYDDLEARADYAHITLTEHELDILSRIVWAEARGEGLRGMILVVNVIMNRLYSPYFPDTIEDVILQSMQFQPVRDGNFDRATPTEEQFEAIEMALNGTDYSQGALFFNTNAIHGISWASQNRTKIFVYGNHTFYY